MKLDDGFEVAGGIVGGHQQVARRFGVAPAGDGTLAELHVVLRQRARLVGEEVLHLVGDGDVSSPKREAFEIWTRWRTCPSSSLRSDELQTALSPLAGQRSSSSHTKKRLPTNFCISE